MRIKSLAIQDFPPIKSLTISDMGSTVIIAGANGAGKTRLKHAIVQTLTGSPQMDMVLEATRSVEQEKYFGDKTLVVQRGISNPALDNYMRSRRNASALFVGSLVQIDSDRNVESVSYQQVNWLGGDPDDTDGINDYYFNPFIDRWRNFMNYIHQKSAARDKKLADELKKDPKKSGERIIAENPDPLEKYQRIFADVLPGKKLLPIEPANPREFYYEIEEGNPLPFSSLSSGEKEVVKVLFDVARKNINHSVIIIDEPELHLHPTLTFKLVETLKATGNHTNQFILLTHSADLISTYYATGDVYFVDAEQTGENQAHRLSELDSSHGSLVQLIGQNLGLFAVGKKLVFVEGEDSSIDRLAYHSISTTVAPDLRFVPVGSVGNVSLLNVREKEIRKSIFGVDIFMVRDRDALTDAQIEDLEKGGRIFCLKRRHIENYFLDSEVLMAVAEALYITSTKSHLTASFIETELRKIAEESLSYNLLQNTKDYLSMNQSFGIPTVKSVDTKTLVEVQDELAAGVATAITNLANSLESTSLKKWMKKEEIRLKGLLKSGDWKIDFQGKFIFAKICSDILGDDPIRVRQAFIDIAIKTKSPVLDDLAKIFKTIGNTGDGAA
ncbi:MAG: AAA family ATPase [Pyrinomonadaceae bacterium]